MEGITVLDTVEDIRRAILEYMKSNGKLC